MSSDITFCLNKCKYRKCFRNLMYAPDNCPITVQYFKGSELCPIQGLLNSKKK